MPEKYKEYPVYKNTDDIWCQRIPKHWSIKRLRDIGRFSASGIDKKINVGEPLVKIVNYTDVYNNKSNVLNDKLDYMIVSCDAEKKKTHQLLKGDLLFTPSSETVEDIGVSCLVDEDLEGTSFSYHLIRLQFAKNISHSYRKYLANNEFVLNQFSMKARGTTRQTLGRDDFKDVVVFLPSSDEQEIISNFLDYEINIINSLIDKQQQLIKLLNEKRQAVISHTITKGLNPDAPMRYSGVEWLGHVPDHWIMLKLSYVSRVLNGSTPDKSNLSYWTDGQISWLASSCLNTDVVDTPTALITLEAFNNSSVEVVPADSLLVGMVGQGKTRGTSAILSIDSCINQNMAAVIPTKRVQVNFLFYLFKAMYRDLRELGRGGNQSALNCEIIGSLKIPLPPKDEQNEIIDYLENVLYKLSEITDLAIKQIDILKERRTALISAAVTGKIDVRNWQPPAPNNDVLHSREVTV